MGTRAQKDANTCLGQLVVSDDDTETSVSQEGVEFVLVPWDTTKPMRRMVLPSSSVTGGDNLPAFVKPYFADCRLV